MKKHTMFKALALFLALSLFASMALAAGPEAEQLYFRWTDWDDATESFVPGTGDQVPLTQLSLNPGKRNVLALYVGNEKMPADGNLTSSNPEVLEVRRDKNTGIWEFLSKDFGPVTLTYEEAGKTLQTELSVTLPSWSGFYSEQMRSEQTYLSSISYDKKNGTTVWCMREGGFTAQEVQSLTVTFDQSAMQGTAQEVQRTNDAADTAYDIRITLPAGQSVSEWGEWLELQGGNGNLGNIRVEAKVEPGLLVQRMGGPWGQLEAQGPVRAFEIMEKRLDGQLLFRPFYGTPSDHQPWDVEKLSITSDHPEIIRVEKLENAAKDHLPCFRMEFCGLGTAVLTLQQDDRTYPVTAAVTMPDVILASTLRFAPQTMLGREPFSVFEHPTIWAMCEEGFTRDEAERAEILFDNAKKPERVEKVLRSGTEDRYDLKLFLEGTASFDGYSLEVRVPGRGQAYAYVTGRSSGRNAVIDQYEVGFCLMDTNMPFDINPEIGFGGDPVEKGPAVYSGAMKLRIAAGIRQEDGQGYRYDEDLEGNVQIKVNRIWLSEFVGDSETYSLSRDRYQAERTGETLSGEIPVYLRGDLEGAAKLSADVTLTLGETTVEHAVISRPMSQRFLAEKTYIRPEKDTVQDLNAFLNDSKNFSDQNTVYRIRLGKNYTGEIKLPDGFDTRIWRVELLGCEDGGTTVTGSFNLNRKVIQKVENICFQADDHHSRAIFGGTLMGVNHCTFSGYEVALASQEGSITLENYNVFYDNEVAVQYNVREMLNGARGTAAHNLFLKNDTAIQVLSLDEWLSPFYLRFTESNFIDNDTDYDIQYDGNYYFYRNYYGELDDDEIEYRKPKVEKDAAGFVMANPRWKHPVNDWTTYLLTEEIAGQLEGVLPKTRQVQSNKLVCDWEDGIVILNDEAQKLRIDGSAFDQTGQKQVDVFNQDEQSIGTWNFN